MQVGVGNTMMIDSCTKGLKVKQYLVKAKLSTGVLLPCPCASRPASRLPDSNPYGRDGLAHSRSLSTARRALRVAYVRVASFMNQFIKKKRTHEGKGVGRASTSGYKPSHDVAQAWGALLRGRAWVAQLWAKSVGAVRLRALPFSLVQQGCLRFGVSCCGPAAAVVGRGC